MTTPITIVVGAGSGLGQATALTLDRAGLTVVAVDRSEARVEPASRWDTPRSRRRHRPRCSWTSRGSNSRRGRSPGHSGEHHRRLRANDALSVTAQSLRQLMDVNLGTALWLTQAVAPHMKERGSGVVVHIAARPGVDPTAGYAAYGVSKATLVHLVRTLDVELRPHGIRVDADRAADHRHGKEQGDVPAGDAGRSRRA